MVEDPFNLVGTTLETKYRLDSVVSEGGYGVVYRAFHLAFEQPIAVKCLKVPPEFRGADLELFLEKFREEGKHLARLSEHRSITRVYDFGVTRSPETHLEVPFMVMEWLEGEDLHQLLRAGRRFSEAEAVALLRPAIEGLAFAHRERIAHRDIKPANLMLAQTAYGPMLKVLDFGIAKVMQRGQAVTMMGGQTSSGFSAFSPSYAAPEQFRSDRFGESGPWTDVHACALVLTEMLTGEPPLGRGDEGQRLLACLDLLRPTPRSRGATVSDGLEAICGRALQLDPRDRYPNAGELLAALDAVHRPAAPAQQQGSPPAEPAPAPLPAGQETRATRAAALDPQPTTADRTPPTRADGSAGRPDRGEDNLPATRAAGAQATPTASTSGGQGDPQVPTAQAEQPPAAPTQRSAGHPNAAHPHPPAAPAGSYAQSAPTVVSRGVGRRGQLPVGLIIGAVALFAFVAGAGAYLALKDDSESETTASADDDDAAGPRKRPPASTAVASSGSACPKEMVPIASGTVTIVAKSIRVSPFCLDRYEVSVVDYERCVSDKSCVAPRPAGLCNWQRRAGRDDHPINCVVYAEAEAYCRWAGKRLPAEAEWQLAVAGVEGRSYPWGDAAPAKQLCWPGARRSRTSTCPVGSYPASAEGVHDLAGNVREWTVPALCQRVRNCGVLRGTSYALEQPDWARATYRREHGRTIPIDDIGFRCAR